MHYDVISADCHIDLIWLPPDLFTANAPRRAEGPHAVRDRGDARPEWVTKNGAVVRARCGMGSAGRKYEPGKIHRSDRMATTGLYDAAAAHPPPHRPRSAPQGPGPRRRPGRGAVRRARRDGALNDDEAAGEVLRIYNEWLADFCATHPERYRRARQYPEPRCSRRRRRDRAGRQARQCARSRNRPPPRHDAAMGPLVEPAVGRHRGERAAGALPHDRRRRAAIIRSSAARLLLAARAAGITSFQMHMADVLMSMIFAGVLAPPARISRW